MATTNYTSSDAQDIYHGDHPDFPDEPVASFDLGSRRWHHDWTHVYKRADGSLWAVDCAIGLTEMQEDEFRDAPYPVDARTEIVPAREVTAYYAAGKKIGS